VGRAAASNEGTAGWHHAFGAAGHSRAAKGAAPFGREIRNMGARDRSPGALWLGQRRRIGRLIVLALAATLVAACGRGSPLAARPAAPPPNEAVEQDPRWISLAPMGVPRQEVAVAELDGLIYVVGGFLEDGSASSAAEVYDVAADRWRSVAPLPAAVHHAGAAAIDGRVYVLGGFDDRGAVDTVWAYDPGAGAWQPRALMPSNRGALAVVILGGRIYAIGGERGRSVGDVAAYDPGTDSWATLPPLRHGRDHLAAGVIGGRIFVAGGRNGRDFTMDVLEEYDPSAQSWRDRPPMPTGRSGIAGAAVDGRLFVFGGEGNRANPQGIFDAVEVYDPAQEAWARLPPMRTPRHGINAAVFAGRIYIPGGATVEGFGVTPVNEAYDTR
jgi:Kelch motif